MSHDVRFLMSLAILIPAIIGIVKFKKLPPAYYPILLVIFLGLANEALIYFLFDKKHAVFNNIYFLVEFLLLCTQFRNWKNILVNKTQFLLVISIASALWILDNLILKKITTYNSLLIIFFPFGLVLMATRQLGFIVANGKKNIIKNSTSVFCIAIILCFSYRVLAETFYHYAPTGTLKKNIFDLQAYVNVIFNILLGIGILLIPKKGSLSG